MWDVDRLKQTQVIMRYASDDDEQKKQASPKGFAKVGSGTPSFKEQGMNLSRFFKHRGWKTT